MLKEIAQLRLEVLWTEAAIGSMIEEYSVELQMPGPISNEGRQMLGKLCDESIVQSQWPLLFTELWYSAVEP
ncbi:hypothetical protein D3C77_344740 [compost metagenome]